MVTVAISTDIAFSSTGKVNTSHPTYGVVRLESRITLSYNIIMKTNNILQVGSDGVVGSMVSGISVLDTSVRHVGTFLEFSSVVLPLVKCYYRKVTKTKVACK